MAVEIKYNADTSSLLRTAGVAIGQAVVGNLDRQVLVLLSGGSCLTLLPHIQHVLESKKQLSNLTIGMVDERFDEKESNFVQLTEKYGAFYSFLINRQATCIDTSPRLKDQYEMADWYEEELSAISFQLSAQNGTIITLLGMGADGHIAGILPYPDSQQHEFYTTFVDTDRLAVGYDATGKNKHTKRFTLTFPALHKADRVFVYITGDGKRDALETALGNNLPLHRNPARYFVVSPQKIEIFTDIKMAGSW